MVRCCSEVVLESVSGFEARYWRLVSFCELRMFFDDALNGSKVKLLDGIVREATVEGWMKCKRAKWWRRSEVWM